MIRYERIIITKNEFMNATKKIAIIGSGPAGYTAALYTSRGQIDTTVYAGAQPGGQLTTTTVIENFPGFENGIDGNELMMTMKKQAERFGTTVKNEAIVGISGSGPFTVSTADGSEHYDAIIVATGARARWLGLPDEERYIGHGYSSCATCDGFFFKGKTVIVVGGGDSAMEEAMHLTHFAEKVYIAHRRDEFRASIIMQERVKQNPKIEILWHTVISEFHGDEKIESVTLTNTADDSESVMNIDGVFVAIGHIPNTVFVKEFLELDEEGYIVPADGTMTSIPGIFAAGDVVDHTYRQAITAAGSGCKAAIDCERWLRNQS